MGVSNFNIHIGTTAQLDALRQTVTEINATGRASDAVAKFQARLAQFDYDRLALAEKINRLKQTEQQLLAQAVRFETAGDAAGAATFNTAVLEVHERLEGLIAEQKREQNRLDQEQLRQQQEIAAASARAESERQRRLEDLRAKLAGLQREEKAAAFAALPPAEQLNQLLAQRADLQRRMNATAEGYGRTQQTQLAYQIRAAQLDAQVRDSRKRADAAKGPGLGEQVKEGFGGLAAQFAAGFGIAAIAGKVTEAARELFRDANKWSDMADRIGVSTEAIQEFEIAAEKSGASLQDVALGFRDIRSEQARAMSGNKSSIEDFQALGLSLDDLKKKSPEQIFRHIAAEAAKGELGAIRTQAAMNVLGRGGDRLLSAFRSGFIEVGENARQAGAIIEDDVVRSLDQAAKNSDLLGKQIKAAFAPLVSFFAGLFSFILNGWRQLGVFIGTFFGSLYKDIKPEDLFNPLKIAENFKKIASNVKTALNDAVNATDKEIQRQQREKEDAGKPSAEKEAAADRDQRIIQLQKQLKALEAETADAALTKEEKIAQWKQKQLDLQRQIAAEADEEKRLALKIQEREVAKKLAAENAKPEEKAVTAVSRADQLQRIGGFRGGTPQVDRQLGLARDQLRSLQSLVRAVGKTLSVRIDQ